jgi:hypothetical protein
MNLELKEDFIVNEEGTSYDLPTYEVEDGKGIVRSSTIEVRFVRGSKLRDEEVERREGTLHEHLLAMMIHDLTFKNGLVFSREGAQAIAKLQEALGWLRQRQIDRTRRQVVGTYKR